MINVLEKSGFDPGEVEDWPKPLLNATALCSVVDIFPETFVKHSEIRLSRHHQRKLSSIKHNMDESTWAEVASSEEVKDTLEKSEVRIPGLTELFNEEIHNAYHWCIVYLAIYSQFEMPKIFAHLKEHGKIEIAKFRVMKIKVFKDSKPFDPEVLVKIFMIINKKN